MKIDLRELFEIEGKKIPIDYRLDLMDYRRNGEGLFGTPVHVTGAVQNRAGVVTLDYSCEFMLTASCDRCLERVEKPMKLSFSHNLIQKLNAQDNDEYIEVLDSQLDLDELVASDTILELPSKVLCRDDCKGLCPECGANRNKTNCGCGQTKKVDPRLQSLLDLLN